MLGGWADYDKEVDEINQCNAILTSSRRWWTITELERFDLGTSDIDRYESDDPYEVDADEEEETSQANDELMHNLEDSGHTTWECEDWTVYFRYVKYNKGEANATAGDVSEANTFL
jgi:hypothetical protein